MRELVKGSVGFCVRAGAALGRVGAVGSAAGAGSRTGSSEAVEHWLGAGRCVLPLLPPRQLHSGPWKDQTTCITATNSFASL